MRYIKTYVMVPNCCIVRGHLGFFPTAGTLPQDQGHLQELVSCIFCDYHVFIYLFIYSF